LYALAVALKVERHPIYGLKGDLFTKMVTSMFFIWRPIYTLFKHIYGDLRDIVQVCAKEISRFVLR
jgi:hypothetical protein